MSDDKKVLLTSMKNGQTGVIIRIEGGKAVVTKLESLGIRVGIKVMKKSALIGFGPVIVAAGGTEVALGHGIAAKIIVEANGQ